MKNYIHKSQYFYGNKISEYGLEHGYVDYRTLARAGDMVLCNNITQLFYNEIGRDYIEPQQVNGYIDNMDEIDELKEQIQELEWQQCELIKADKEDEPEYKALQEQIQELDEQIDELEREQDEQQEIYQYYIISDGLAEILKDLTNEIIYYIDYLDIYIWGITHYGTGWDYVLTDIKIDLDEDAQE